MRLWVRLFLLILVVLVCPRSSQARPQAMSDQELDEITASGAVDLSITANPSDNGVDFAFNLGSTVGTGSVGITPVLSSPTTLVLNGGSGLPTNATFYVQNMVINLNICVACNATKIIQTGMGIPITVTIQP